MINWFINLNTTYQALLATFFTFLLTALGASLVFFFKKINKTVMDCMLGFSAGLMLAASFFSLIMPAINMSDNLKLTTWLVLTIGFLGGCLLLLLGDKLFDKLSKSKEKNKFKRSLMLVLSITLHNFPEGLAVGVAFGSLAYGLDGATLASACMLALGIGIQNFPEGTAISVPLRREGFSRKKAFFFGQLSGWVEPVAGILVALLVLKVRFLLPYTLAFAAGAMIYVVIKELIPESQATEKKDLITIFTILGFTLMMILDIALG